MTESGLVAAADYTDIELAGTVRALGPWWALLRWHHDPALLAGPARAQVVLLADALGLDHPPLDADPFAAIERLAEGLPPASLPRDVLDPLIDACLALIQQAGRSLATAGAFTPGHGVVHGLYVSGGGVPKRPVPSVEIGVRGLAGDDQRTRQHHGRPWQAVCLWSKQQVDRLAAEGHPITYGSAGENVSVDGLDWATVEPCTRMQIGAELLLELAPYALPCSKNAQWFVGGDFNRMHHEREPGISRIYASVLRPGSVSVGDPVVLEP